MSWKKVLVLSVCIVVLAPLGFWGITSWLAYRAAQSAAAAAAQSLVAMQQAIAPSPASDDHCEVLHVAHIKHVTHKGFMKGVPDTVDPDLVETVQLSDGHMYKPDMLSGGLAASWPVGAPKDLCDHVDAYDGHHRFYLKSEGDNGVAVQSPIARVQ